MARTRSRFRSARDMLEALTDVLRVLPDSTDAMVLGRSVREARQRLLSPT